jgi:glycine/D-amino acid oxidase-like deaminating enzyme
MLPVKTADIVIVGGGVMGASAAYHLAARGMHRVVLLEREQFFGSGATGRCAGGVRYQFGTEINVRLSIESLRMLRDFPEEIGQAIDFRRCGYMFVLTTEPDVATFRNNVKMQQRLGVGTQWLSGDEIRRRLPLMSFADALGGTFNPDDGIVDPGSVVNGYISAAQRLGAVCLTNVNVTGIGVKGGIITAIDTPEGSIETPLVLNAAGPWSGQLAALAGLVIPVEPVRRQWFTSTPLPALPADFPFVIDFAQSLYFHREGGGLLIGMSNPAEHPGFDQNVDEAFELVNLEAAVARMPLVEQAGRASHWAGLYEVTADAHPIFGRTPIQGFYLVTGFSGHGFMHGPVAGKLMAELILDGHYKTVDVSMLDLGRFEEGRLIQEYNVV